MSLNLKKEREYGCSNCKAKFRLKIDDFGENKSKENLYCPLCEAQL
jgi:DNA-directed RNA polymerase subunit RPC12/RpoP